MLLFSIRNNQTGFYNPPFVARDVADAQETVRKAIISGRDVSLLVELENLDLCLLGSFDARSAELVNDLECIVSLSAIPLPDHIEKLISKLKGEDENCSSQ